MDNSNQIGRPKIGEHEKRRRKAHRDYWEVKNRYDLLVREIELDFLDSNIPRLGRSELSIGELYDRAKQEFNDSLRELNNYEKLVDAKISSVGDIKRVTDPAIDNGNAATGRPKNNELAELDHEIRYLTRQIDRVLQEPETLPEEAGRQGNIGRPKTTREERLHSYRTRRQEVENKIAQIEIRMESGSIIKAERDLKKARDRLRFAKMDFKKASGNEKNLLANDIELHEESVKNRTISLKAAKKRAELVSKIEGIRSELQVETSSYKAERLLSDLKAVEDKYHKFAEHQKNMEVLDEYIENKE